MLANVREQIREQVDSTCARVVSVHLIGSIPIRITVGNCTAHRTYRYSFESTHLYGLFKAATFRTHTRAPHTHTHTNAGTNFMLHSSRISYTLDWGDFGEVVLVRAAHRCVAFYFFCCSHLLIDRSFHAFLFECKWSWTEKRNEKTNITITYKYDATSTTTTYC